MSRAPKTLQTTERVRAGGMGHGPGGMGMVGQKAMAFGPSLRRLAGYLAPQRLLVGFVVLAGIASVALSSVGPRVLGRATDLIFGGLIGKMLPAGLTKEQAIEGARAAGQDQMANLLGGIDLVPGQGVDFGAVGLVLGIVVAIYVGVLAAAVPAGLPAHRRRPAHRVPPARARRDQAQPRCRCATSTTSRAASY